MLVNLISEIDIVFSVEVVVIFSLCSKLLFIIGLYIFVMKVGKCVVIKVS